MEMADRQAALLLPVTQRALVIVPIRIGIGLAGLAIAALVSERPYEDVLRPFVVGAVIFGVFVVANDRRRVRWVAGDLEPMPANARVASLAQTALDAAQPSTFGITVLMMASLFFDLRLVGVMAGLLVVMGLTALVSGVALVTWERRWQVRVYATGGLRHQFYAEPRS
jgi:hypothetical protein